MRDLVTKDVVHLEYPNNVLKKVVESLKESFKEDPRAEKITLDFISDSYQYQSNILTDWDDKDIETLKKSILATLNDIKNSKEKEISELKKLNDTYKTKSETFKDYSKKVKDTKTYEDLISEEKKKIDKYTNETTELGKKSNQQDLEKLNNDYNELIKKYDSARDEKENLETKVIDYEQMINVNKHNQKGKQSQLYLEKDKLDKYKKQIYALNKKIINNGGKFQKAMKR